MGSVKLLAEKTITMELGDTFTLTAEAVPVDLIVPTTIGDIKLRKRKLSLQTEIRLHPVTFW